MSVHLYLSRPGGGKSTLLRQHVYETRHDVRAFLILDRDMKGTWLGPVFTSTAQVRALSALPRWCVFQGVAGGDVAELAIAIGDTVLVDEEVHRTIVERPWKPWDPAKRTGHPLYAILHEGRHLANQRGEVGSVSALIATHRPSNLPADLPALCDSVYLGCLPGYADADRCYREGWVPDADGPRAARAILAARRPGDFSLVRLS